MNDSINTKLFDRFSDNVIEIIGDIPQIIENYADDLAGLAGSKPETSPLPLDPGEMAYLRALLSGGDWKSAAKSAGKLPSLLNDSINTKLFDRFSDNVIGIIGDIPQIIEDYADDLALLLKG